MKDEAGALCNIIKVLVDHNINIEYAYAFTTPTKLGAYTVLRVDKTEMVEQALAEKGYELLTQQDMNEL